MGDEIGRAIALHGSGNAYIAGQTSSTNFPTKNAFQSSLKSNKPANNDPYAPDAFVVKITEPTAQFSQVQRVAFGKFSSDASKRISFEQFLVDSQTVGQGFIDGQPGADQILDQFQVLSKRLIISVVSYFCVVKDFHLQYSRLGKSSNILLRHYHHFAFIVLLFYGTITILFFASRLLMRL